jgi:hypothetical protein
MLPMNLRINSRCGTSAFVVAVGVMMPHFRIIIIIIIIYMNTPCGGGLEYLHRSIDSRRKRPKGNPVPGGVLVTVPPSHWRGGGINTGTWSSRLGVRHKADHLAL